MVDDELTTWFALRSERAPHVERWQTEDPPTKMGAGTVYRIVVSSELSERYAPAFEGMKLEAKGGRTILTGEIVDQAHLYGILNRIARLGLTLMSVESFQESLIGKPLTDNRSGGAKSLKSLRSSKRCSARTKHR